MAADSNASTNIATAPATSPPALKPRPVTAMLALMTKANAAAKASKNRAL